ncbi:zinc finger MYM-type protein 5-like isoform X3 [Hemicordylus capensis]|uniref:zinc finger MYM-type protein 5-like isoform X3 n=1 Tax=Hemicordylus capensis TaxID=884348 RepID=UPI0023039599|nr:zinc finger MYM-type protein 5-like isoform X3 [Hemicordylus capensis]
MMPRKKASGAEGWKRRRLEAEEAQRSSRFLESFLTRPGTSSSTPPPAPPPAQVEEEVQPDDGGSSAHPPQVEEEVQQDEEAATESVDVTGGQAAADVKSTDESETGPEEEEEDSMCIEPDADQEPLTLRPEVIERHDIGLLQFDQDTGRPIIPDTLRTEMIKLGAKFFQNSEGPFLPTRNRAMNKTWFRKRLGSGHGEEVTRKWLLYSPSKRSAFCFCCLLFSRSEHQSTLEQESGFNHWKAPERICVHENAKNHRECFTQWKEMERNIAGNRGLIDAEL